MITKSSSTLKVYYRDENNESDYSFYTFNYVQGLGLKNVLVRYEVKMYNIRIMPRQRYFL